MNHELMLTYLALGFFHQDYDVKGKAPIELVREFAESDDLQTVQLFYSELAETLARNLTEEQAKTLWMDDAYSMYDPNQDGVGNLDWLRNVLVTVGEVLRQRWLTPRSSLTF